MVVRVFHNAEGRYARTKYVAIMMRMSGHTGVEFYHAAAVQSEALRLATPASHLRARALVHPLL